MDEAGRIGGDSVVAVELEDRIRVAFLALDKTVRIVVEASDSGAAVITQRDGATLGVVVVGGGDGCSYFLVVNVIEQAEAVDEVAASTIVVDLDNGLGQDAGGNNKFCRHSRVAVFHADAFGIVDVLPFLWCANGGQAVAGVVLEIFPVGGGNGGMGHVAVRIVAHILAVEGGSG